MRLALPAAALVAILAAACGKVGDPKPPVNRTPLAANSVRLAQSGHTVTLSWTNPAHYVDTNQATDLAFVRILRNGVQIAREKALPAGQPQSFALDASKDLDADLTFAVQIETDRGRVSPISEIATIRPKNVPGAPRNLQLKVDVDRIILDWMPPEQNANLADIYLVQRSDKPAAEQVMGNHYEDEDFEPGKEYKYSVTAARAGDPVVLGVAGASEAITAKDGNPPEAPAGLTVDPGGAGTVIVRWDYNTERDVREYLVYRSDRPNQVFARRVVNLYTDMEYRSGLAYEVSAVDKSDNESKRSPAKSGP